MSENVTSSGPAAPETDIFGPAHHETAAAPAASPAPVVATATPAATAAPTATTPEAAPARVRLADFCAKKSKHLRQVELISAFHTMEARTGHFVDTEENFEAAFKAFAGRPAKRSVQSVIIKPGHGRKAK